MGETMKKILILCLLAFCFANGEVIRFVVMPCMGVDPEDDDYLVDIMQKVSREALKALPTEDVFFIPSSEVTKKMEGKGGEALYKACAEGGACWGKAGGDVNADYDTWCEKKNGRFYVRLYDVNENADLYTTLEPKSPETKEDMAEIIRDELPAAIKEQIVDVIENKKKSPQERCKDKEKAGWGWADGACKQRSDINMEQCTAEKDKNGNSVWSWIDGKCIRKEQLVCNDKPGRIWDEDAEMCKSKAKYECDQKANHTWDEKKGACKTIEQAREELELEKQKKAIDTGIKNTEPIKISFWAGIGLEVLGAAMMYVGYTKHQEMQDAYDKYKDTDIDFGDAWDKVESAQSSRNTFYTIGGLLLASGIGVHIWF